LRHRAEPALEGQARRLNRYLPFIRCLILFIVLVSIVKVVSVLLVTFDLLELSFL